MIDVNAYWLKRGRGYHAEKRLDSPFYKQQEKFICDVLRDLNPASVLDVGCGFGRVTSAVGKALPGCSITGCELSLDQLEHAEALPNVFYRQYDLYSDDPLPSADVAMAIEVFLHHPSQPWKRHS